jgi:hypothetical protein
MRPSAPARLRRRNEEPIIDELRDTLKRELLRAAKYRPVCPVSGQDIAHTASLHEIVCPPLGGSKYHPQKRELATAVFVRENCLLLSPDVNVNTANSLRAELLQMQMMKYGPWAVIGKLRVIARFLKTPAAYLDRTITFDGRDYRVLRPTDKKG